MSRHSADEISGSEELQRRLLRHQGPATMSVERRDEWILTLAEAGSTHMEIGKIIGMSRQGVAAALVRIRQGRPGRVRGE